MSDSILVRVTLDSYDIAHPSEKQTQVYVQIPEVARASWLLNASLYTGLKLSPWPNVVDAAIEDYDVRHVVADAASTNARAAVRAWLRDAANRDEMQAAYELDQARRSPITRKLLEEKGRLLDRIAELEKANVGLDDLRVRAIDKNDELRASLKDAAEQIAGLESDLGGAAARVAELEAAQGTVYRASHDSIVMGLYTTADEARKHCETVLRREIGDTAGALGWIPDDGSQGSPEELFIFGPSVDEDGFPCETDTGYVVTPLEVAAAYDPDGDE